MEEKLIEDSLIQAVKPGYVTIKMIYKNMTSKDVKLPEHRLENISKEWKKKAFLR